jgi:hypothetical protein
MPRENGKAENQENRPTDQTGQGLQAILSMYAKVRIFAKKRTFLNANQHKARRGAGCSGARKQKR